MSSTILFFTKPALCRTLRKNCLAKFRVLNLSDFERRKFCQLPKLQMANNKVLNVAEKNDVAKGIAEILSNGRYDRRPSFSKYNQIYEFDFPVNLFNENSLKMTVTSVSGHLLNYEFTGQANKNWANTPVGTLFQAPIQKICTKNGEQIRRTLENEARKVGHLVIWTDCDREGENIGFEIIEICRKSNKFLVIHRARFSEITRGAINRAVRNLVLPNQSINEAVDCRQELDLRIGAAFTRFQTLLAQRQFPDKLQNMVISYGSCQFPTLGFVVERYKQNELFVAEPFWKLVVEHRKAREGGVAQNLRVDDDDGDDETESTNRRANNEIRVEFNWARVRLFDKQACEILHLICTENPTALVENVIKKPKTKRRPVALETISLEKVASKKLRLSARRTMDIAQRLYTKGFISYPRTETNKFPPNFNLADLVQLQVPDHRWGDFAQRLLNSGGPQPHNGQKSDEAHPPIHPIRLATALDLQNEERQVYDYVVRHFLACVSRDAKGNETLVHIDVAGEKFTASGLIITERNFLEVYPYEKWSDKELPDYQVGENFRPSDIRMSESLTSAPSLLSEADLISLMERHGIGTDATHAEHIEKIKDRRYIGLNQSDRFVPGFLGLGLVEGYDAMGYAMSKPNLRAELERALVQICEGTRRKDDVLREQLTRYKETFEQAFQQSRRLIDALAAYFGAGAPAPVERRPANPAVRRGPVGRPDSRGDDEDDDDQGGGGGGPPGAGGAIVRAATFSPSDDPPYSTTTHDDRGTDFGSRGSFGPRVRPATFDDNRRSSTDFYNGSHGRGSDGSLERFARPASGTFQRPEKYDRDFGTASGHPHRGADWDDGGSAGAAGGDFRANHRGPPTMDNSFLCHCGEQPIEFTVKKAGPNRGRKFFSCPRGREVGCKFFAWSTAKPADDGSQNDAGPNGLTTNKNSASFQKSTNWKKKGAWRENNASNAANSSDFFPVSVKWSGGMGGGGAYGSQSKGFPGDKGRKKMRSFQNNDDASKPLAGGYSVNNLNAATRSNPRKCSVCRQAGHFANRCPTKL